MSLDFLLGVRSFRDLMESLGRRERNVSLAGMAEPARPYVLACLTAALPGRLVCVLPGYAPHEEVAAGCRYFLSHLSPGKRVSVLPGPGIDPGQELPIPLEKTAGRMKFFFELSRRPADLILTDLRGLLKPFPAPEVLPGLFLEVERGARVDREDVLRTLGEFGYVREELIASHGELAWRGGIVDVFSPWEEFPFRLEFSGGKVASLRTFDPSSQASLRRPEAVTIPSLREFPGRREFFEEWAREAARRAGSGPAAGDARRKAERLLSGDVFPDFAFLSLLLGGHFVPFDRYLKDAFFLVLNIEEVEKEWKESWEELEERAIELAGSGKFTLPPEEIFPPDARRRILDTAALGRELTPPAGDRVHKLNLQSVPRFVNNIPFFLQYIKKLQSRRDRCCLFLSGEPVRKRIGLLLGQEGIDAREASGPRDSPRRGEVLLLLGDLAAGFGFPEGKIFFFSEKDVLTAERVVSSRIVARPFQSHFQDLRAGDHIVHADYGIGLFQGLFKIEVEGKPREFIDLRYRDGDKLYVPVEDLSLVQKYAAAGETTPALDKLGTGTWERTKQRAKRAVETLARELLELYARRKSAPGFGFSPAGRWQSDFEKMFPFEETEDQRRSIREIYADMEAPTPMDRLLCGDVGYGKTEVAMRAVFKAVMDGKQAAVLCPTTVLASQHLNTFRSRLALFPVRVEALTRLQSPPEQKRIREETAKGGVDVLIGTHRLLSGDVAFRDLGLLIVDEEQRFGVSHKEKIKQLKTDIDVLTLTATPIPRTLNLSLTGVRDISLIETPPRDRLAVSTVVTTFNPKLVAAAVRQELRRGGQAYYIHNRVEDIGQVAANLERLVPEARVSVVHGQMAPRVLEKRMLDFTGQRTNVLVSTTIIENGIDIPQVNTLIVDRADLYGLAQLYQLRGRVGRSSRQATAYFLVPPFTELSPPARKRLRALQEFSELGSGFRLAAKDLEIRGAGNLLGFEQHGALTALGYDYFLHLLAQAVKELQGEKVEEFKPEINLKADIRIPEDYLPQVNLRLHLYKKISSAESLEDIGRIEAEMADRFGPLPDGARNLLAYGAIKRLVQGLKVVGLDRSGSRLTLRFHPSTPLDPSRLPPLLKRHSGRVTAEGVMIVSLSSMEDGKALDETLLILKELDNRANIVSS
ncbi:MAG: transcription-repair coupling factor [Candidatus Aminicenantes bacterium]|nr:transcription-repair coupling factor [Candidatus Aminicenantes bacterium]